MLDEFRQGLRVPAEQAESPGWNRRSDHALVEGSWDGAGEGVDPVVLFALDQFCLIGYPRLSERGGTERVDGDSFGRA